MSGKRKVFAMMGVAAVAALMILAAACEGQQSPEKQAATAAAPKRIREPAVAGLFYPKDQAALSQMLDTLLANATPHTIDGELRAFVCPHAGYRFSGPVAATAYRLLSGHDFQTVVIMGPSHWAGFAGASVANADVYRTPLGDVPVSPKARELAKTSPFVLEPRCFVQRPPWSSQASHAVPPAGEDTPETWEHSGEVQVPFLQKTLKNLTLVPIVTGPEVDPEQMARALAPLVDDKTLVVASSDLSHYNPYDEARAKDKVTTDAIVNLDIDRMKLSGDACGKTPVLALMYLAKQKGWKATLLDYRNSGDTAGNKDAVVGYAAIALYTPRQQNFTTPERKLLLDLARRTLREVVKTGKLPDVAADAFPAGFTEKKGCFVTLTKRGQLRGCIGHIFPQEELYKAIMDNARNAALRDYRFTPVQPDELDKIEIEVSVLTVPEPLTFSSPDDLLNKLRPHRDGVVLQIGGRGATYLPQVWQQIPDKVQFMNTLAEKAGCPPDAWRSPDTKVLTYHVEAFKESEM